MTCTRVLRHHKLPVSELAAASRTMGFVTEFLHFPAKPGLAGEGQRHQAPACTSSKLQRFIVEVCTAQTCLEEFMEV